MLPFSIIDNIPEKIDLEKYINYIENPKKEMPIELEDEYVREIKNIKSGQEGSREFEIVGERVIKFLFRDEIILRIQEIKKL